MARVELCGSLSDTWQTIHKECVTDPVQSCHDVVVTQLLSVEQIHCRDVDGVCGPKLQFRVTSFQVQRGTGCLTQYAVDQRVRDELGLSTLVAEH